MRWETVALEEVAAIERSGVDPMSLGEETPYVGLEHIEAGGRLLDIKPVSNGELKSTKFVFGPDHILYGKLRPYLAKIAMPRFAGICSTDILPILPSSRINRNYLCHFLRQPTMIDYAASRAEGANLPRLSPKALAKFEIPLPPLDEQKRIATILDKADQLRQKRRQAIALLDSLTQSIFLEMFGDLIENDRAFPEGHASDWVDDFETGKNLAPDPDNSDPLSYRVLKVSAVTSGIFKPNEVKALPKSYQAPPNHLVRRGDLLFSRANTAELVGATAMVDVDCERIVLPDKIWRFAWSVRNRPNPLFVHGLFSSRSFRDEISKRATGTSGSMKNISKEKVLSIRVGMPARKLQDDFSQRIEATQGYRLRCENQNNILEAQFSSLQHRAFSGQL